jgi:flagellar motor switch protein FliG
MRVFERIYMKYLVRHSRESGNPRHMVPRFSGGDGARLVALIFALTSLWPRFAAVHAAEPSVSPDMALLDQESKFEREKTEYLQENVLDKILGPGKAVVIVDVEMGLESRNTEMGMSKGKSDKKKNPNDPDGGGPAPQARVLVPGVPMPKSPFQMEEDRGGASQEAGGAMQQKKLDVRTTIKKLLVHVLYDKRVKPDKLLAVKQAIVALLKVSDAQMVFTPTTFTETAWEQLLTPKWIIPLALAFWLMLFLWGPLASFFKRLNAALEDKSQKIEQTMTSKSENEEQSQEENEGEKEAAGGGGGDGEGDLTEDEQKALEEQEEAMKKFEPFQYVSEQNIKGLAYLLRKEEPWIVALVLSYLKPEFAKEIFASFPPEVQARVAVETATIRQTSLEQVMSIDEYVKKKIDFVLGGVDNLIKILNETDKSTRENILDYLKNEKPVLYERVREEVILFEDVLKFPDAAIQVIVREIGTEQLARALKDASPDYINKFLINMSAGAAALLKESMDYGRPLTPEQIEEERKKLMDIITKLERENKISVRKKAKRGILEGEEAADDSEPLNLNIGKAGAGQTKADPARAQSLFQAGATFYEQGNLPEALRSFHEAVQADPSFWQAYQYMGTAYASQGMMNEAMGSYERMLELNPNDPSLREWVLQFKAQQGVAQ